ncbi:nucleotidyltransferase domain-containing protein [Bacteroidota bacterium]
MKRSKYIKPLIEKIKEVNPARIILFGSYAYGEPDEDSDIDILVVTSDDFVPQSFDEKMKINLAISGLISEIKSKHPVDLIVHTIPMHKKFISMESMFSKKIISEGKIVYEGNNPAMAS